ncbi:MAG TPA: hypothetical protein VFG50_09940 [Rhodothermales bacterium]|nr:hypothetical protein [Rhodothermales bacterium]
MRNAVATITLTAVLGLALAACAREQKGIDTDQPPEASGSTPSEVGQPPATPRNPAAPDSEAAPSNGAPGAYAILPGKGIGHITLGENLQDVNEDLGRPDSGDAAMGHVWAFWLSKTSDDVLGVYATFDSNATGHYVREIRVTSPVFHLPSGLSSGDPFSEAQRQFEHMTPVAEYTSDNGQGTVTVFDAVDAGVAFEVAGGSQDNAASGNVVAILVHRPGRAVTQEYLPYPNFRRLE